MPYIYFLRIMKVKFAGFTPIAIIIIYSNTLTPTAEVFWLRENGGVTCNLTYSLKDILMPNCLFIR